MDLRKVKKLIELAEESDLAEIEVSGSDESVRIVRNRTRVESQPDLMQSISAKEGVNQTPQAPALDLRSKSQLDSVNSVSYTHLTLPKSDLV